MEWHARFLFVPMMDVRVTNMTRKSIAYFKVLLNGDL